MANVILVIDMLRGFYDIGNLANPRMGDIIPNVKNLLERMTANGWKVYFLADNHEPDDLEFQMFPPHCVVGTKEIEVVDELKQFVAYNNYIPKTRYSGFYNTNLEEILRQENPKKVIVAGVCTDICVLHTIADLPRVDQNHQIIVPKNCVETYDAPDHPAGEINRWAFAHIENVLGAQVVEKQEEI
jgi:nicotinamidase/pyrazinamidase